MSRDRGDGRVGVVVLTYNRRDDVVRTLGRIARLPERPRVVLVDNASPDDTAAVAAARFPDVTVVRLPGNIGAAGRNAGMAHLDTPYVAFCDDDTWWSPGSLARAADLLDAHPRLAVVSGRVLVGPGQHDDPGCTEMAASPLSRDPALPGVPVLGFMAAAAVVRRAPFVEVGGFERRFFLGSEEHLIALDLAAAGWALAYVPELIVHHHPSPRRDTRGRRRLIARNALWAAWLRRPLPSAVRRTRQVLRGWRRDAELVRLLCETLGGARWVLHQRRVVPDHVEAALREIESAGPRRGGRHDRPAVIAPDRNRAGASPAR